MFLFVHDISKVGVCASSLGVETILDAACIVSVDILGGVGIGVR
jgi:hypothetical protein